MKHYASVIGFWGAAYGIFTLYRHLYLRKLTQKA